MTELPKPKTEREEEIQEGSSHEFQGYVRDEESDMRIYRFSDGMVTLATGTGTVTLCKEDLEFLQEEVIQ
ncbi:MAG: hypothetical protein ABEJ03_03200 [Candidatus Nanohaloarchaea archaeon]